MEGKKTQELVANGVLGAAEPAETALFSGPNQKLGGGGGAALTPPPHNMFPHR